MDTETVTMVSEEGQEVEIRLSPFLLRLVELVEQGVDNEQAVAIAKAEYNIK